MGNQIPIRIIGSLCPSIFATSRGWRKNLQFPLASPPKLNWPDCCMIYETVSHPIGNLWANCDVDTTGYWFFPGFLSCSNFQRGKRHL
jgi:hypothetical protein